MYRFVLWVLGAAALVVAGPAAGDPADRTGWTGDLTPITSEAWTDATAAHLLRRAGFGGSPEDIARLAVLTPAEALDRLMTPPGVGAGLPPFDHSGVHDPGLEPFPQAARP